MALTQQTISDYVQHLAFVPSSPPLTLFPPLPLFTLDPSPYAQEIKAKRLKQICSLKKKIDETLFLSSWYTDNSWLLVVKHTNLYQNPAQNYCPHKKTYKKETKKSIRKMYFSAPITTTKLTKNRRLLRFIPPKKTLTKKTFLPIFCWEKNSCPLQQIWLHCQKISLLNSLLYWLCCCYTIKRDLSKNKNNFSGHFSII